MTNALIGAVPEIYAAGVSAVSNPSNGQNDGGEFTADATLTVDFGDPAPSRRGRAASGVAEKISGKPCAVAETRSGGERTRKIERNICASIHAASRSPRPGCRRDRARPDRTVEGAASAAGVRRVHADMPGFSRTCAALCRPTCRPSIPDAARREQGWRKRRTQGLTLIWPRRAVSLVAVRELAARTVPGGQTKFPTHADAAAEHGRCDGEDGNVSQHEHGRTRQAARTGHRPGRGRTLTIGRIP